MEKEGRQRERCLPAGTEYKLKERKQGRGSWEACVCVMKNKFAVLGKCDESAKTCNSHLRRSCLLDLSVPGLAGPLKLFVTRVYVAHRVNGKAREPGLENGICPGTIWLEGHHRLHSHPYSPPLHVAAAMIFLKFNSEYDTFLL